MLVASGGCWWHAEVVGGKRRLLVASGGCWWQAEVICGKPRLLVASGDCRWQTEVVCGKQRLLVASRDCWWQDEVVGRPSCSGVHRFQNLIYHQTLAFPGLRKGLPPVSGSFKGRLDPSSYSAPKFMAKFRLYCKKGTANESILAAIWHNNFKSNIVF